MEGKEREGIERERLAASGTGARPPLLQMAGHGDTVSRKANKKLS